MRGAMGRAHWKDRQLSHLGSVVNRQIRLVGSPWKELPTVPSPSACTRRLAAELLRLREAAGISREHAADQLGWSVSKLWRVETARSRAHHGNVADMLDLYAITSGQRETLIALARQARRRGWWHSYADIERRLAVRMRRQELAASRDTSVKLWAVLDEAVLRPPAGSPPA